MPVDEAKSRIGDWKDRLQLQTVISASEVQNKLFELYGDLEDVPAVERVKPWLTLTVRRELFSAKELQEFLDELGGELEGAGVAN